MAKKQRQKETMYNVLSDQPTSGRGDPFVTAGVQIKPDHMIIGEQLIQTFELAFWPPSAVPGFVEELLPDAPSMLVVQAQPESNSQTIKKLGNSLSRLQSSHREGLKKGIPDPELERRIQDAYQLRDAVNRGSTRFFTTSLSVITYTPDVKTSELNNVKNEVQRRGRERSLELVSPLWQQEQAYKGSQPGGRTIISRRLLETNSLSALFPWTDLDYFELDGIPVGINFHTGNPLILNRWTAKNQHWIVTADTGSGKSYFIKETLSQEAIMGRPVIILDPSRKKEYAPLVENLNGTYIPLGVNTHVKINPLQIWPDPEQFEVGPDRAEGRPVSSRISLVKLIIVTLLGIAQNDTVKEARIDKSLRAVYQKAGFDTDSWAGVFNGVQDRDGTYRWEPKHTWPILSDLHAEFIKQGYEDFAEAMEPFIGDGTTNMLDGQTTIDVLSPVVGFGINHLISVPGSFSRAAYAVVMDFCVGYFGALRSAKEKLLIIDESHNLLRDPVMSVWLELEFREARKAGVGVTAISQSALDFLNNAKTIWNNSSAKFFLSQPAEDLRKAAEVTGIDSKLLTSAAQFPKGQILAMLENGQVYQFTSFVPPEMEMLVRADAYTDPNH